MKDGLYSLLNPMDHGSNLGYLLKAFLPTGSLNFFMELFFLDILNSTSVPPAPLPSPIQFLSSVSRILD